MLRFFTDCSRNDQAPLTASLRNEVIQSLKGLVGYADDGITKNQGKFEPNQEKEPPFERGMRRVLNMAYVMNSEQASL